MATLGVRKASDQLVSVETFLAIVWTGFSICTVGFCTRVYIRWTVFRKLLVDDWMMLFALVLMCTTSVLGQLWLKHVYTIVDVGNGALPTPTFLTDAHLGLLAFGCASLLWYIGIWVVKCNFLIFFYRLGNQITVYLIFWWVVLIVTVGCGATGIGLMQYECLFAKDFTDVMIKCAEKDSFERTYMFFKVSVSLDVISDALIVCFPIAILWRVRTSLRKKLMLSGIFALVGFTMAVTIVRGSVFGGVYKNLDDSNLQVMNITWIWFWFNMEFMVAFLIACLVSFRALFANRDAAQSDAEARQYREQKLHERVLNERRSGSGSTTAFKKGSGQSRSLRMYLRSLQDTLLDTCHTLEGTTYWKDGGSDLPMPPSHRLSVDFSKGAGSNQWSSTGSRTIDEHSLELGKA